MNFVTVSFFLALLGVSSTSRLSAPVVDHHHGGGSQNSAGRIGHTNVNGAQDQYARLAEELRHHYQSSAVNQKSHSTQDHQIPHQSSFIQPQQSSFDRPHQNSFDQPRQSTFDQPRKSSFDQFQQSGFDRPHQISFDQPRQSSFDQPQRGPVTSGQRGQTSFPQVNHGGFQQHVHPAFFGAVPQNAGYFPVQHGAPRFFGGGHGYFGAYSIERVVQGPYGPTVISAEVLPNGQIVQSGFGFPGGASFPNILGTTHVGPSTGHGGGRQERREESNHGTFNQNTEGSRRGSINRNTH